MNGRELRDRALALARIGVGGWFVYAALDKLARPELFSQAVANYQFLPEPLINLWALALPPCELAVGLCLVLGIFVKPAALLVSLMSLSFVIALTRARIIGLDISCGCFEQVGGSNISNWTVLRDLGLLALCLALWLWHTGAWGLGRRWRALR